MYYASRVIRGHRARKRIVIHYIWVGLTVIFSSTVVAVLSATGVYWSLPLIQGLLYRESSIMGLPSAEQERPTLHLRMDVWVGYLSDLFLRLFCWTRNHLSLMVYPGQSPLTRALPLTILPVNAMLRLPSLSSQTPETFASNRPSYNRPSHILCLLQHATRE
jgi:hypothetical protein